MTLMPRHVCHFVIPAKAGIQSVTLFRRKFKTWIPAFAGMTVFYILPCNAAEPDFYVEPGSLRLSHEVVLEGVFHKLQDGWRAEPRDLNKIYSVHGNDKRAWNSEWGQRLLTEAATRITPDISGRILFELQGEYADRFWRPINIHHYAKEQNHPFILRQAEGRIDKDIWYMHGFSGVAHGGWEADDFFDLYPASNPEDDYLNRSGFFGVYPARWRRDLFLDISKRHVPRGVEAGGKLWGLNGAVAYGDELTWGFRNGFYGRVSVPVRTSNFTFVGRNEDVPYRPNLDDKERNNAYSLTWDKTFEAGHRIKAGVVYQPFRLNEPYRVARRTAGQAGLLGSSYRIETKTTNRDDAFGERLLLEYHADFWNRLWIATLDLTHADILAGNKDQVTAGLVTDITPVLRGTVEYTYRRPVEGPLPFLYEGTPDNIGAIASSPRGPESPFWVNWSNREAVFLVSTLIYDPTPGSQLFVYRPTTLELWNINEDEQTPFSMAVQHRMSDYKTTTDRQTYINEEGEIRWESAGFSGAWASDHPLHEFRILTHRQRGKKLWTLGIAGGQQPALSGLAYSSNANRPNKPITEYFSIEGRLDRWPWAVWGHFGSGVWGPDPFYFFGESFDRLFGTGVSYKFTKNTSLDVAYLGARQDDSLFQSPNLGSYDEVRTLLSHRFGFLFQFREPARPGYKAR